MIPYVHVPSVELGPVTLHPFGMLVAVAIWVGTSLAERRARKLGMDLPRLRSFVAWVLVCGFVGGHVIDAALYRPAEVAARPWMLLLLWEGQGSYGGFVGALAGALLWKYCEPRPWIKVASLTIPTLRLRSVPEPILPLADLLLSVFPVAWIFGRMGCSVAHDHMGIRAEPGTWLAVQAGPYEPSAVRHLPLGIELRHGEAPQFDLGLLELFFTIVLASALVATWRWRFKDGFYVAIVALSYAPIRFLLDFLRIRGTPGADARYAGLTPAQWACTLLFLFGVLMVTRATRTGRSRELLEL
jgi:phosphatidylglycerol---prolipoprotein diacylglyceryl transferase